MHGIVHRENGGKTSAWFYLFTEHKKHNSLADPGGAAGAPPQQDPILSFSHTFLPKSTHVGGRCPPRLGAPPTGNPGSATVIMTFINIK